MSASVTITHELVRRTVGRDNGLRRLLPTTYQYALFRSLAAVWPERNLRVLDVGCGAGRVAAGYIDLLNASITVGVDVANRFAPNRRIPCVQFDGVHLPFRSGAFDVVAMVNVLHHVPDRQRIALIAECVRVTGGGPIIVKDHVALRRSDYLRLAMLDVLGNLPAGGMVKAEYLTDGTMDQLFASVGYSPFSKVGAEFRTGLLCLLFPNRLEQTVLFAPHALTAHTIQWERWRA